MNGWKKKQWGIVQSNRSGTTQGGVNDETTLVFGWTIHLMPLKMALL